MITPPGMRVGNTYAAFSLRQLWGPSLLALAALPGMGLAAGGGTRPRPEMRAVWVDSWNRGFRTPAETEEMVANLHAANVNTIVAEVRKVGDAYYQSSVEPRAEDMAPGYDALADVIQRAHALGMEVHAWFVVYRVGNTNLTAPAGHVLIKHPDWMTSNRDGQTVFSNSVYLDPGVPEVANWTCAVIADVVRNYDIDAVHLDYIRYPTTGIGYNPLAVARFNAECGRVGIPMNEDPVWCQWRRDQVTSLAKRIYVETTALKPWVKVIASVIAWSTESEPFENTAAYREVYQDWNQWTREGYMDAVCPMVYRDESQPNSARLFREWLKASLKYRNDRHLYMGQGSYINTVSGTCAQLAAVRESGAEGATIFNYSGTRAAGLDRAEFWRTIGQTIYAERAPIPEMPWKPGRGSGPSPLAFDLSKPGR